MSKLKGKTTLVTGELDPALLQQSAFRYFLDHTNVRNGLVADTNSADSACSIAATGLGLSCYPVAVTNGWLKRADVAERVLTALRFFEQSPQGPEPSTFAIWSSASLSRGSPCFTGARMLLVNCATTRSSTKNASRSRNEGATLLSSAIRSSSAFER